MEIRITASVVAQDPDVVARALETLSRATAGLALEGIPVIISASPEEEI